MRTTLKKLLITMSRRKQEAEHYRSLILAESLPATIEINLKGRSRVAVKTVRDLELYMTFIEELSRKYHQFYGFKKVFVRDNEHFLFFIDYLYNCIT